MAHIIHESKCVTCYECWETCPFGAVVEGEYNFKVDPDRCVDCGKCETVCRFDAITEENAPVDPPAMPHDPESRSCDAVIIGAGASGLVAAVRVASLTGKKVIVLESAGIPGGCGFFAGMFNTAGSKLDAQYGIPDQREAAVREAVANSFWKLDPKLIGNTFYSTGPFLDWIFELEPDAENDFQVLPRPETGELGVCFQPRSGDRRGGRRGYHDRGGAVVSRSEHIEVCVHLVDEIVFDYVVVVRRRCVFALALTLRCRAVLLRKVYADA